MKTYFFTIKHAHWRDGRTVAVSAGVVNAADEAEAVKIINEKISSDSTFNLNIYEVQENYFEKYIPVTVFK